MSTRVLTFGMGAVGSVYSYVMHRAGAAVTVVCRSNYETVRRDGLTLNSRKWGEGLKIPPPPASAPQIPQGSPEYLTAVRTAAEGVKTLPHGEDFDFVLVTSKASSGIPPTSTTADLIRAAVGPSTAIVVAQNGIAIEEEYAREFPRNVLISGVVYLPVTQTESGVVEHDGLERLEVGVYQTDAAKSESEAKLQTLANLFAKGEAQAQVFEDVQPQRWSKLLVNAAWNPICALSLLSDADFLRSSDEASKLVKGVMAEVVETAGKKGYGSKITKELMEWQFNRAAARLESGGIEPSMLADVRNGRTLEVEPIVGNTVRIAQDVGVPTPNLNVVYALVKGLNESLSKKSQS